MGRNQEALEILRLYCDLATTLEDHDGLSRTYSHMGAIYRKMGLHREGAEMFAKAKVLNGDIKNLVGDQPLSESMLNTMVLPSAAARRNRTLEILEENASSETNDKSLDTTHNCSPNHSPDQRVDEWEKNLDLSLQIDMESGRNWIIREDDDLKSPARDSRNSSTDVCEEPDTESVLEHRDQEESQERKIWQQDIAAANSAELLITLPLPTSQHDEDPDDAEAQEEGHAADAEEERDISMENWDPNSAKLLVTLPLPACQYGEDVKVDANEEKAAATEVARVMANEEGRLRKEEEEREKNDEHLRKMEEERSAAAEAARIDAERIAAAHAEAARKEQEEMRGAAEAGAAAKRAAKRAVDEAAAKKAEQERAAAVAAASKKAEEKAAAAAAREEEIKRLEEERRIEEAQRKRQKEEEERKRIEEEQGHAADVGTERGTSLEHRDQEEFQERRAWEQDITAANSAELLVTVNLPLPACEDLDEVDPNEGRTADAEEERVQDTSLERAEVKVVTDEDGAHCHAAHAGGSPGDDSVSLLSSDLDICTRVESFQHEKEEAPAHVAVAVQDWQVENVGELGQPQHCLKTGKRANMEIESDATAHAAGGLAEEAIMVENCLEQRRLEDSEPALSAYAQMPLDMSRVDCLVQAQTQDAVDGMQMSSRQDTHHNKCQVAELPNDAAIENANPRTSASVSPSQPAASEFAGELLKTSKDAARTLRGIGDKVPPTNINSRSLMYSWLHAQKLPSMPEGSAMPESSSLPPFSWIPEQEASQTTFFALPATHDSSASEDSNASGMSTVAAATELPSKMFGWLHVNEPGPYTPRNNRSVESMAQGSLGMSPRTSRRPSGILLSPRPDPHVNPRGSGNVESPPMDHLAQRLPTQRLPTTPRSTVRPEVREVFVDCYWLPELHTCARPANDLGEWMICPVEAERSPHQRSLSPVLIPECASHNLVSPSPVLHLDSTWQNENQQTTVPSQGAAEMRYLF